jgi:hypothetical protein
LVADLKNSIGSGGGGGGNGDVGQSGGGESGSIGTLRGWTVSKLHGLVLCLSPAFACTPSAALIPHNLCDRIESWSDSRSKLLNSRIYFSTNHDRSNR